MGRHVSNPLALAVLAYLLERPMHPYELGKVLKQRNAQESIKYRHASLYMVVDQLSRDGYIEAQETAREGQRPERTVYRLTDVGATELQERMRELVAVPAKEYPRFEAALALIAVLPPDEVTALLDQRQGALEKQVVELRGRLAKADIDPLWLIEHEYRLGQTEAELQFLQRFRHLVTEGGPEFGAFWRRLHANRSE
ncbi:PadR family transcriptional regulator [Streptomyces montanus]|uniref:PadR family transcriptional regulator n=1 Tax=Streptomyces montanus TaxID=2580423 RepID=A0A5R9FQR7_9ACTN|nr:helix-turn-helix transcriptional regulator [Streptomyces montanus]TLS46292.1 PadR family transcriptional regulator [Streptomyces montanus]